MTARPRGRPREFDEDAVLDKALDIFWKNGYSATSLDELCTATGLNRPSLYSAFGDKKSLYRRVLRKFEQDFLGRIEIILNTGPDLKTDLLNFYNTALTTFLPGKKTFLGCPVICTASVVCHSDDDIRNDLSKTLIKIDFILEKRFARAIKDNELDQSRNPTTLGRIASALIHSLAIRVRATQTVLNFKEYIKQSVDEILAS